MPPHNIPENEASCQEQAKTRTRGTDAELLAELRQYISSKRSNASTVRGLAVRVQMDKITGSRKILADRTNTTKRGKYSPPGGAERPMTREDLNKKLDQIRDRLMLDTNGRPKEPINKLGPK